MPRYVVQCYRYSYTVVNLQEGESEPRQLIFETVDSASAWRVANALKVTYSSVGSRIKNEKIERGYMKKGAFTPEERIKKPAKR